MTLLVVMEDMGELNKKQGVLRYEVKWKGYNKRSDRTREPIENM